MDADKPCSANSRAGAAGLRLGQTDGRRADDGVTVDVQDAVAAALRQEGALGAERKLIVAVSGGCDSVALLHALLPLREGLGFELHVASLDHGIRGEAGRGDVKFVGALAERWSLPYTLGAADAPALSQARKIGIEEAARRVRYAFLARVADEQGSDRVLVGHHADDQAETILMRMTRGTGIRGLGGMRPVSPMPEHAQILLIRPLLKVHREEIERYCRRHDLPYRHDKSNDDRAFARNFLRHEVIGRLRRLNPQITDALARLGDAALVDDDFIAGQFEALVLPHAHVSAGCWRIAKADFLALHPALQRRFLQRAFQTLAEKPAVLPGGLTLELIAWLRDAASGKRRDMGAALQLRICYDDLCVSRKDQRSSAVAYHLIPAGADIVIDFKTPLELNGICIRLASGAQAGAALRLPDSVNLRLRARRKGDRFKPKGMAGHSLKLKDWMIDRKIPREIRDGIPLLCADGAIVAICLGDVWHLADLSQFDDHQGAYLSLILQ